MDMRMSGPIFDGRAAAAARDYTDAAERDLAEHTVNAVRRELATVLQHPTGRYQASIHDRPDGGDRVVAGQDHPKGPWLAGVTPRNRTTRFRGYDHWPAAAGDVDRRAVRLAEQVLPPYLRRMG
jgi:hypothetical protein